MFKFMSSLLTIGFVVSANAGPTLVVRKCDTKTPQLIDYLVSKRSFDKNNLRIYQVNTYGEPACCGNHVLIYVDSKESPGETKCFHLASLEDGTGYWSGELETAKATFKAEKGLTITLPVSSIDPSTDKRETKKFEIHVDPKTGKTILK